VQEVSMMDALEVVLLWKRRLRERRFKHLDDVVDAAGYTEICLGLTPWTVGHDVALQNYIKNLVQPWNDMEVSEQQTVVDANTVVVRSRTTATHTGEFLGCPPTGRRVSWDAISMVRVESGRVVGQWAQPDLFAIYRQISDRDVSGAAPISAPLRDAPAWAFPTQR
jgi:predicted ester cyclase